MRFFLVFAVANSLLVATGAAALAGRTLLAAVLAPLALLSLAIVVRAVVRAPRPAASGGELREALAAAKKGRVS